MPAREYINPDTMAKPPGFTQVVRVGNTVYIAGQVAMAPDGSVVGKGDPEAQARQVWHNIDAAMKSVGGTVHNVVKTTTFHVDWANGAAARKVRDEVWAGANPPTSTGVKVAALAGPDYLLEIECIGVVGE